MRARIPVDEMRRGESAIAYLPTRQEGRRSAAYGSFAIGASDVYCLPRNGNVLHEPGDPLQARLDHDPENLLW